MKSDKLRDKIVSRHRSGEGYKEIQQCTVDFIILKWKKFGTTRTLPRTVCLPKLSHQGGRSLVREVTKNPMITPAELLRSCVEIGETSRRTTITATLHRSGQTEASPQWRTQESLFGVSKNYLKDFTLGINICLGWFDHKWTALSASVHTWH